MLNKFRFGSERSNIIINFLFIGLLLSAFFTNCAKPASEESNSSVAANDVGASFSGQLVSELQYVSTLGEVWGYAYDPKNKSGTLKIIFYVDGPVGIGEYAGETQANIKSIGPNAGHFFSYKLPAKFADSRQRVIVAYAVEPRSNYTLYPGSISYTSFTPKAEAFFNQRISGFVQSSCARCHTWNYMQLYSGPLMKPTPGRTGTAINNTFISKISGVTSHSGGSFCNGVNEGICVDIQAWWRAEFN
jgi:hypothetical protein